MSPAPRNVRPEFAAVARCSGQARELERECGRWPDDCRCRAASCRRRGEWMAGSASCAGGGDLAPVPTGVPQETTRAQQPALLRSTQTCRHLRRSADRVEPAAPQGVLSHGHAAAKRSFALQSACRDEPCRVDRLQTGGGLSPNSPKPRDFANFNRRSSLKSGSRSLEPVRRRPRDCSFCNVRETRRKNQRMRGVTGRADVGHALRAANDGPRAEVEPVSRRQEQPTPLDRPSQFGGCHATALGRFGWACPAMHGHSKPSQSRGHGTLPCQQAVHRAR